MSRFEPHPDVRPAVVTGASSGIGTEAARALADAGLPVVLGARRLDVCEAVAAEIRQGGGRAVAFPLDLADAASIDAFAKAAIEPFGPIEVVVSNAAAIRPGRALPHGGGAAGPDGTVGDGGTSSEEALEAVVRVNLFGPHRLVARFGPGMVERARGDLLFVTSDVVAHPRPSMFAYVSSKWALEGYINALQMELEGSGVRASIVRPGPTLTGMGMDWDPGVTGEVLDEWVRWGLARHSNFLRPSAVAAAIVATVTAPRGTHLTVVEVHPEAPVDPSAPIDPRAPAERKP
ncbi:MAG TPA: SDR family oxidoreductase [Acidimicrobiales bacterium]|jgi:NAD(P)-dependent dehydrogenase (short-subunit alcohol dehydrogenase family)|nr:SDR family oxidoreductase [Acidimicrobiales bacterium]